MKAVVQRVSEASVDVDGIRIGEIAEGVLILVCAMQSDTEANADKLTAKIAKLRIFRDEEGRMNRSLSETGGAALIVSQFTLAADTSRGNRPGFSAAAPPEDGARLYEYFITRMQSEGISVQTGQFGADMKVRLLNDGPVTIPMEF
ncbi:D-aminoacyl-tRNA deacylase [Halocynthiibacter namhaensis]|uniref:D-aminoacyl-tRNA deacylase n=1 Tax=Halocynthiibacter namhaensis TaxID=1290553 RepID=UPI0005799B43|nr:D-aminoacyl-tRNA deacylase [Halocynthiibacter namhaensis]